MNFMKWGDLGGFCGFLDSGPPGGPPFGPPLGGPPLPGRTTKIAKLDVASELEQLLGSRKFYRVLKYRKSLRIEFPSRNG